MKDYTATVTIVVSIRAPNEEAADTRAQVLADRASAAIGALKQSWVGDIQDCSTETEEEA